MRLPSVRNVLVDHQSGKCFNFKTLQLLTLNIQRSLHCFTLKTCGCMRSCTGVSFSMDAENYKISLISSTELLIPVLTIQFFVIVFQEQEKNVGAIIHNVDGLTVDANNCCFNVGSDR